MNIYKYAYKIDDKYEVCLIKGPSLEYCNAEFERTREGSAVTLLSTEKM